MREQARLAIERLDAADAGKEALRLWLQLFATTRLVEKEIRARLRSQFGTTLPRFDVLAALERVPEGLDMSELSRRLMVSNGNVTGVVQRLEEEGLVRRVRIGGDRRRQHVRLSRRGAAEFRRQSLAHERWVDELMGGLSTREQRELQRLLRKAKLLLANREEQGKQHGTA